ncbi:Methyl-accepting chemotaxis protein [Desulfomicrobium norvegicum]|uniref:Methyl-accepting chemotaxis protein n=1 Tax=Desulfomicrobium norvegicum (strain DSM 1741 / NCIMB 8310) TaxID=52561 RepID=A0A8G2FEC9_DESNO|nr:Methyl-accepting chemotaxis protein [Desulfomicrobium norvegicum]
MGKNLGFQIKLSVVTIAIVLVTVLCLSLSQIFMTRNDVLRQGRDGLFSISSTLVESVTLQHALMQKKIIIDRDIMKTQFELGGFPVPEVLMDAELDLVNQEGGESSKSIIPAMKHGSVYLHEDDAVMRKVAQFTGGVASVLQVHEGKLVRISTSLESALPFWGKGSFIGEDSAIQKAVMANQSWEGIAWLGGAWRMAAYVPFTDLNEGKVLGALEITHPLISDAFADFVRNVRVDGHGGTLAFDALGRDIISLPEEGEVAAGIREAKANNGHAAFVMQDGRHLEVALQTFEPWNLTFATWVATEDLMDGVNARLIKNSLISLILPLALSVILICIAGRVLLAPVRRMAMLADEVAAGNYTATIVYPARDEIGHLADSLNSMVAKSREMLAEIVTATGSLSGASSELDALSTGLTDNSAGTTRRAEAVNSSAKSVSENMHSVSAAMEQATVNVGSVAASTTELAATIQGVAQSAELAKRTTSDAVVKAAETTRHMDQLGKAANEIGSVTASIAAISSQTNLLALNATIEAARAGAAGRGFAVVAGEIKELSQQTAAATENIRRTVAAIQKVTTVTASEIAEIISVIEDMNDIVISISEAMEEQAVMTRDISNNVNQVAQGIAEINSNVTSSSVMTREISDEIRLVLDSSNAMQDESRMVLRSAGGLADLSSHLEKLVSRFRF